MEDGSYGERFKNEFLSGFGCRLYGPLIELLESEGLKPQGSANSHTLQFIWTDRVGKKHALVAFRKRPERVMSFPKAFWQSRSVQVSAFCERFPIRHTRSPSGPSGKESFREVLINDDTLGNLIGMLKEACQYAKAQSS
ncbi:hypothetical protein D7243_20525 [Stutzerimonas stutzeri]|nr:hypothetical protein [Stutzerimonas stutzeri]